MGFKQEFIDFWKPGWKHPDPKMRVRTVSRMTSKVVLMDVYEHDEDATVRATVVSRLKDQALLTGIAKNDKSASVRLSAVERIADQAVLADLAKNDESASVRLSAVERITDQALLADLAKNAKHEEVRLFVLIGGGDINPVSDASYSILRGLASGSDAAQGLQKQYVLNTGLSLEVKTKHTDIKLRLIPPGSFTMGSLSSEDERRYDETPHPVMLTRPYYCGKFAVTQGQWKQVMGNNPSKFTGAGDNAPVENVSWEDCQKFLTQLCKLEGVPEGTYRLLTEAQWEYACRAGTSTAFCYGESLDSSQANFDGNYPYNASKGKDREKPIPVGNFKPNAFGLYDMHGNVREWCNDWYGAYPGGSETDPTGASSSSDRVYRGGSWYNGARHCRSAHRLWDGPSDRDDALGFRLARITPVKSERQ
jgi:formylglycine-generating enzyme required for sulfatase activity